ncbi:MAG: hypothetical protein ACREAC_27680 [Blastocatellia bacterium]
MAYDILSYLERNPSAEDTIEGIVQWWLLEQKIQQETAKVKEALADLVTRGLVVERHSGDNRVHYGMNRLKHNDIESLVERRNLGEEKG